jgi:hypothetical protein
VKYTSTDSTDKVVFGININLVNQIRFSNGTVHKRPTKTEFDEVINYDENRKRALKLELFSPIMGHLTLGYEKSIRPGRTYEFELGLIGLGRRTPDNQPNGLFIKGGYKFLYSGDYIGKNMPYSHVLNGPYIKPEIILGSYNKIAEFNYGQNKYNVTYAAILLNFGKQVVLDNALCLDIYLGIGYGTASVSKRSTTFSRVNYDNYRPAMASHGVLASHRGIIAISGGFKVGFLLR